MTKPRSTPLLLLARAERSDPSEAPSGPFLVARYVGQDHHDDDTGAEISTNRFCEVGQFAQLCDAVASIVEGWGCVETIVDALESLETSADEEPSRDDDQERDGTDEDDEDDVWPGDLPFSELRARLIAILPELSPLMSLDYLSFALDGTLSYCTDEYYSFYLRDVESAFPGWEFYKGWGAVPHLHDLGIAILRRPS